MKTGANDSAVPKKKRPIAVIIIISIVVALGLAAAGAYGVFSYAQKKAQERIDAICESNEKVTFIENEPYYDDYTDNTGMTVCLYVFDFQSSDKIIRENYDLAYDDEGANYKDFVQSEETFNYYLKSDLFGHIILACDLGEYMDLKIETDENNKITALGYLYTGEKENFEWNLTVADAKYYNDLQHWLSHKEQYDNIDNVIPTFLNMSYYGYSVTWEEALDNTFITYDIDVEPADDFENGYRVIVTGEYSINPISLPDVTNDGELVLAFNNDLSDGEFISGSNVKQACDLYVSLGTTWYLDRFGNY